MGELAADETGARAAVGDGQERLLIDNVFGLGLDGIKALDVVVILLLLPERLVASRSKPGDASSAPFIATHLPLDKVALTDPGDLL